MKSQIFIVGAIAGVLTLLGMASLSAYAEDAADPVWEEVDKIFGYTGKSLPGDVHKYGWPRSDLKVHLGNVRLEPALALGSWGAFQKTGKNAEVRALGDLVLLESEVNPVVTQLQVGGLEVVAIHNHLINESPKVIYVHFSGQGEATVIAKTLKDALERTKTPIPPSSAKTPLKLSASEEDALKRVQTVLGYNGSIVGRVLQVSVQRSEKIEVSGMEVPPSAGTGIALNFQTIEERVATTGDFVLVADEVSPVIRELRSHGINVTALHSHMLSESPRLFFLHFWGIDTPEKIAEGLKAALAKVRTR